MKPTRLLYVALFMIGLVLVAALAGESGTNPDRNIDYPLIRWMQHNKLSVLYLTDEGLFVRLWSMQEDGNVLEVDNYPFQSAPTDLFSRDSVSLDGRYRATVNEYGVVVFCLVSVADPEECRKLIGQLAYGGR